VLSDLPLPALLEELAAPREVPGAGSALAVALAAAAGIVQKAARLSDWEEAPGIAAQAAILRDRAQELVQEDADVYRRALEARLEATDAELGRVTAEAAEPPLTLASAAADIAELARVVSMHGDLQLHADVAAAAALAVAVARGARELVAANLTALPGDPRIDLTDAAVHAAEDAAAAMRVP
jgi:formiminotetrahydrofolate cyclodeaminase